jgi:hypothetical protein
MNPRVSEILQRIRELEAELEAELESRREALHVRFEHHRVRFAQEILHRQRQFKTNLIAYLFQGNLRHLLSAPIIYSMIVPLLILDFGITLYQRLCFPLYRINLVMRGDHMAFDHRHLAYLNVLEKFNCLYCSYGNGVISYTREIIARTEQYWCPIRHARRLLETHSHYGQFADYGDAEAYRRELDQLRNALHDPASSRESELP